MISYLPLSTVAECLRRQLETLKVFDVVSVAAVDSYSKLAEHVKTLAAARKAVVLIGSGDYANHALTRRVRGAIAIIAPIRCGAEAQAGSVWQLVDAVANLLTPRLEEWRPPQMPQAGGAEVIIQGWSPLDIDAKSAGVLITFEAVQTAHQIS